MARAQLSAALAEFERIVDVMRGKGVSTWAGSPVGDIVLGPPPPPKPDKAVEADPKTARRVYYTDVLGRQVTDSELEKLP